jgi:hypothetical protein
MQGGVRMTLTSRAIHAICEAFKHFLGIVQSHVSIAFDRVRLVRKTTPEANSRIVVELGTLLPLKSIEICIHGRARVDFVGVWVPVVDIFTPFGRALAPRGISSPQTRLKPARIGNVILANLA